MGREREREREREKEGGGLCCAVLRLCPLSVGCCELQLQQAEPENREKRTECERREREGESENEGERERESVWAARNQLQQQPGRKRTHRGGGGGEEEEKKTGFAFLIFCFSSSVFGEREGCACGFLSLSFLSPPLLSFVLYLALFFACCWLKDLYVPPCRRDA